MPKLNEQTLAILRQHVNPTFPAECVKEATRLAREMNFGFEFWAHIFTIAAWLSAWADGQFEGYGASETQQAEWQNSLLELQVALGGQSGVYDRAAMDWLSFVAKYLPELIALLSELFKSRGGTDAVLVGAFWPER